MVKKNGTNVYLSVESIDDLNKLLSKNFKIKNFNNKNTEKSFISTYNQNNNNQIGIIKDLLNDHYYTYYLMSQMIEKNDSLFGNYFIFYTNFEDYSSFIYKVNELVGYDTHSSVFFTNIENYIAVLIVGSLLFLLLFYFIFQVYEYYNNSKKIGCMKLLGFDISEINKNMIYKNLKIYLITILIIFLFMVLFVKNIMLSHILFIILVNLSIVLLTYFFSNYSCRIISKTYQTTNILKKQNTTLQISQVSYKFRIIMIVLLICFSMIAIENISSLSEKLKIYNNSKNLLEYGVLESLNNNHPELHDYEKHYNLYLKIINSKDLETVYAQFYIYEQLTAEELLNIKNDEEKGTFFQYDSIDNNYLKKEKIKVYNLDNKEIDIDTIKGIYFLFAKSKKNLIEPFKNYHEKEFGDYYHQFNDNYVFQAYLYDDRNIDTYRVALNKHIKNPILRVVDNSINVTYIENQEGISTFGNGINTGLKIKLIDGDKEKTANTLEKYIDEAGLSNLLKKSSFTTYKNYFNDEILASQLLLLFITLAIIIIVIVYNLISFQLLKLYIKSEKQKILVKKLLGFDNHNIFEQIFKKSLNNTFIAIVLSLVILIIIKKLSIIFIIIALIILILDFIIILLSTKSTKLSEIYLDLKGGNYD